MAPRPNWKGYLKLSLVSCAVSMFPAVSSGEKISFHTLNRETGHRLRRQMVDGETGDVVDDDDQIRGYEVDRGDYVELEDAEIDALAIESTHTIDIERFVRAGDIDPVYLDTPYFLAPNDKVGEEAFAVIRQAMADEDVVGLARVVMFRRERIVRLAPHGRGLMATTLHYTYEVRSDRAVFKDIAKVEVSDEMLDLATHIIKTKSGKFDPSEFEDRYETALVALIKAKQKGEPVPKAAPAPKPAKSADLLDMLRRSLKTDDQAERPASAKKAASTRRGPSKRSASAGRRTGGGARKAG